MKHRTRKVRISAVAMLAGTALLAGSALLAAPATAAPVNAPGTVFRVGDVLRPTQAFGSTNAQYYLAMHADGNLVIVGNGSVNGRVLWSSGTAGHPGATFTLQSDDNAVIRSKDGKALWSSGTSDKTQNKGIVTLGMDGKLNVLDNAHAVRWQSHTIGTDSLKRGILGSKSYLYAGAATFTVQEDGNLVSRVNGKVVWSSHTPKHADASVTLQSDGNLVLYEGYPQVAVWSTKTAGSKADKLTLSPTGKLRLVRGSTAVWTAP